MPFVGGMFGFGGGSTPEHVVTSGALAAQAALIDGAATRYALHLANGALEAQAASISGVSTRYQYIANGSLLAGSAAISGSAVHSGARPIFRTIGAQFFDNTAPTAVWPSSTLQGYDPVIDDLGILVIHHDGNTTMPTPSGWEIMPGSPVQDVLSSDGVSLSVFYKRVASIPESNVTLSDVGAIQGGIMLVVSGVVTSGSPVDVYASNSSASASTTHIFPAVTTTVVNPLMVYIGARPNDDFTAHYSGYTSASGDVTDMTERFDSGAVFGTGHGIVVFTGNFTGPGDTDQVSATCAASTTFATLTLALKG